MDVKIIEDRIKQYGPENKRDELNAFKEISQEITLLALSRANFFKHGAFQGGTCLRIAYGLNRFSEDLDFILYKSDPEFKWHKFLNEIVSEFTAYGLTIDIKDRSKVGNTIKKAFLKENSFGKVLELRYERNRSDIQTITIKLEVDTNPPLGSEFENKILEFPLPFSIITQKTSSLFSGKVHALLCRQYLKGRDWYDFIWYVTRKAKINIELLQNALQQQGPWQNQTVDVDQSWVINSLKEKIENIDWEVAKKDVLNFVKPRERASIDLWNKKLLMHFADKLSEYLK